MPKVIWKAPSEVQQLLEVIKKKHHSPRLDECSLAVCFEDSKPFLKNKLNLGKLTKFGATARLYQEDKFDFCLIIPSSLWQDMLNLESKKAYLDLQLTRCSMEYEPEVVEENGKKKKIMDEFGRVQYSNAPKYDAEGNIKWKIEPLDLEVFAQNVSRYGLWQDDLITLKEAIDSSGGTSASNKDS